MTYTDRVFEITNVQHDKGALEFVLSGSREYGLATQSLSLSEGGSALSVASAPSPRLSLHSVGNRGLSPDASSETIL